MDCVEKAFAYYVGMDQQDIVLACELNELFQNWGFKYLYSA